MKHLQLFEDFLDSNINEWWGHTVTTKEEAWTMFREWLERNDYELDIDEMDVIMSEFYNLYDNNSLNNDDKSIRLTELIDKMDVVMDYEKLRDYLYDLFSMIEPVTEGKKSGVTTSLKKKSKASGIPVGILRQVFRKGMQAWNAGHRPGVAQHQWGLGRVNSFITGAGGARKADAALWARAKAAKARKKKKKK